MPKGKDATLIRPTPDPQQRHVFSSPDTRNGILTSRTDLADRYRGRRADTLGSVISTSCPHFPSLSSSLGQGEHFAHTLRLVRGENDPLGSRVPGDLCGVCRIGPPSACESYWALALAGRLGAPIRCSGLDSSRKDVEAGRLRMSDK